VGVLSSLNLKRYLRPLARASAGQREEQSTVWPLATLRIPAAAPSWARDKRSLEERLAAAGPWFHSMAFDNGATTNGRDPSEAKLRALQLPADLSGHSLVDIGSYEGYFSFHAAQRGARVTANDHFVWQFDGGVSRRNFDLAHEVVGSPCEVLDADVGELASLERKWDVVLFLGVLYHLPDPVGGLRAVRAVTKRVAIVETLVDCLDATGERCAFYSRLNNDTSNHFGPNLAALVAMTERAGFGRAEFRGIWELNTVSALSGSPVLSPVTSGRAVFYLYP
jgi:tRNA (mo5U34)-methyltransferase